MADLSRLKNRDPEAISQVVKAHAGDLLRAALGMGLGLAEAEDLVQSIFTAFLEALDRFEGRSSVRTYLFGILYRKMWERGRQKSRELPVDPSDALFDGRFDSLHHWSRPPKGPQEEAETRETAELIRRCLEGLTDQQRAAFQLKEAARESSESICNILGIENTHLRVLLFRARNKLRECLESKWSKTG